jgi:hypothetical protein
MIVSNDSIERLEDIFQSRYGDVVSVYGTVEDEWLEFLNKHDCSLINLEDIKESFQDMVNFDSAVRNGLCVNDPHGRSIGVFQFVIVPREFAEKLLVLGGFPD